jgi:hypothetical protein
VPLAVLAVAEALGARTSAPGWRPSGRRGPAGRGRRPRRAPVRPVEPMLVARLAVLAQASAYVGAVFAGHLGRRAAHVGPAVGRLQAAGGDTVTASIGVVARRGAGGRAALWLESVCRVPPSSTDEDPHPGVPA